MDNLNVGVYADGLDIDAIIIAVTDICKKQKINTTIYTCVFGNDVFPRKMDLIITSDIKKINNDDSIYFLLITRENSTGGPMRFAIDPREFKNILSYPEYRAVGTDWLTNIIKVTVMTKIKLYQHTQKIFFYGYVSLFVIGAVTLIKMFKKD